MPVLYEQSFTSLLFLNDKNEPRDFCPVGVIEILQIMYAKLAISQCVKRRREVTRSNVGLPYNIEGWPRTSSGVLDG